MEPKPKKLWLKDGEAVKTAMVVFALAMSALSVIIMLGAVVLG
jgi:hypothetical protein